MSDLQNKTDKELDLLDKQIMEEKERRRLIEKQKKLLERTERQQIIVDNIDVFLQLASKHNTGNCTDSNSYRDFCTRCVLLRLKKDPYMLTLDMDFEFTFFESEIK
jgi:hypothetical protein